MCLQGIPGERGDFIILRVHFGEKGTFHYFRSEERANGLKFLSRVSFFFFIIRLSSFVYSVLYFFKGAFRGKGEILLF